MSARMHATVEGRFWAAVHKTRKHLIWTGRVSSNGTPVFDYDSRRVQAMRVAYTIRTGRQPEGPVTRACKIERCVNPACMEDARDRRLLRAQIRALEGLPTDLTGTCGRGHDKATHWRINTNGFVYCAACQEHARLARQAKTAA